MACVRRLIFLCVKLIYYTSLLRNCMNCYVWSLLFKNSKGGIYFVCWDGVERWRHLINFRFTKIHTQIPHWGMKEPLSILWAINHGRIDNKFHYNTLIIRLIRSSGIRITDSCGVRSMGHTYSSVRLAVLSPHRSPGARGWAYQWFITLLKRRLFTKVPWSWSCLNYAPSGESRDYLSHCW